MTQQQDDSIVALARAREIVKEYYPEMPADYSGRRVKIALAAIKAGMELERAKVVEHINAIEPDEEAAGCPAAWGDFVQIVQTEIEAGRHHGGQHEG